MWSTLTLVVTQPCSDVRVGGVVPPPCIIISWFEFVFWECILYLSLRCLFLLFQRSNFSTTFHTCYRKTRLTSSLQFFQLIFGVKYFFGGHHGRLNRCFKWRGLMHEAGEGMGEHGLWGVRTTSSPPTP